MASSPNAVPASQASFCAIGSCLPMGLPHCVRSAAHSRAIFSEYLTADRQKAGSESRPVFRVVRAIRRPLPSPPMTSAFGTKTSSKRVTEFSMPLSPMNSLRCSTVMPSRSYGQRKAVMPPWWPADLGTTAMTTTTSAIAPFVAHSFVPLIR